MSAVNFKCSLSRANFQHFGLLEGRIVAQLQIGRAAGPELMTVRAVDMQIGARLRVDVPLGIVRISQFGEWSFPTRLILPILSMQQFNQTDMLKRSYLV